MPVLPRRFGRYQLFDRIGKGGMAEIYLARAASELGAERLVVVKQIHEALSRDESFARMFIEEAKLCAGLRHANVVQVLELGREDGLLYMAMEYVEGFDLHQLLARCSRAKVALPAEFALFIVREVLAALDFAHRATDASGRALGIVHRDVSPSNVLMSLEGEVKLCDFGIARAAGAQEERSGDAKVVGKSAYMSPEHARGEALDARADVFAAGILLWELCAGRRLYRGSEEEMLELARRGEIPALPERGLPQPEKLQAILDRALARDRDARYATAAQMRAELDEYAHGARLFASQIRFGAFLSDHFGEEFVKERRARERAARALELGPPVRLEPIAMPAAVQGFAEIDTDRNIRRDEDTVPEARALPAPESEPMKTATTKPRRSRALVIGAITMTLVLAVLVALMSR
ncbi:serine/threonine-protein kinase [Sandaracinus amylolyticus]|uniref:Serine/threonine protein kinase n=1 Tax=Sandaracinus amylolyticus TaxID=927083 RepID=A0A0F6SG75_9BACT|nr:serine/threonine-protein kinase [Sandaracinus amylolyticus]AKF08204.1 serine/threonine protein kinase [Sandaracinus amylolyticus]